MDNNRLTDYNNYFHGLARTHKLIKAFVVGDIEEILAISRSELSYPCLWLETPSLLFTDNGAEQIIAERAGALTILDQLDSPDNKTAISEGCEAILLQVLGKMHKDRKARIFNFNLNGCNADFVNPIAVDNNIGWRLEFKIGKFIDICYTPSDWDESKTL